MPIDSHQAAATPVLGMNCSCGASTRVGCQTVGEIPQKVGALSADGWGYDARGFVRCPECRHHSVEPSERQFPVAGHGRLL